jgi:hypothetical protein
MRLLEDTGIYLRRILILLPVLFFYAGMQQVIAQEDPPRPIVVTATAQSLAFGAFYHGPAGGSVSVSPASSRSSSGSVVLLGLGYIFSAAMFEIVGNPGTVITLLNGSDVTLAGSNGGSMTLSIGSSNPVSPFVLTNSYPVPTQLTVGGTLTVGNSGANPPGSYGGTFEIIFNQQ